VPVLLFIAFQIKPVQKYVNNQITVLLQKELNTNVSIGYVFYNAPFDLMITDIYVEDYQADTLFFVQKFKIRPLFYNFKNKLLKIDNILINGLKFEYRADTSGFSNLDYFLANLPISDTDNDTSQTSSSTTITIKKINVEKSSMFYSNASTGIMPYQMDIDTINFKRFSAKIRNFKLTDDSITMQVNRFAAYCDNGFKIRHLSSKVTMIDETIKMQKFSLALNHTKILAPFVEIIPSELGYQNISNLIVDININKNSIIETKDLAYFSPIFKNYSPYIKIGIIANGTISNISVKQASITFGNNTSLNFSGNIIGLPTIDSTYFDIKITDFLTSKTDLVYLKDPETMISFIEIPASINLPELIQFNGTFNGFTNNFDVNGELNSSSGFAQLDIDIVINDDITSAKGNFELKEFNIGYILKNESLGKVTLKDSIDITMIDSNTFDGYNYSDIEMFEYNNYNYQNIKLSAKIKKDSASVIFAINDPNIILNANLKADLSKNEPFVTFDINLDTAKLFYLNLITTAEGQEKDIYSSLSTHIKGYFSGSNLSNIKGSVAFVEPLYFIKNMLLFQLNDLFFNVDYKIGLYNDTLRSFSFATEFFEGFIQGEHNINDLKLFASNLLPMYFPAFINSDTNTTKNIFEIRPESKKLSIDLKVKDLTKITDFILPTVKISKNSIIKGEFNSKSKNFFLNISSDSLIFSGNRINNFELNIFGDTTNLTSTVKSDSLSISKITLKNFVISSSSTNNNASILIKWDNKNKKLVNLGQIAANITVVKDTSGNIVIKTTMPENNLTINSYVWKVKADSINLDSSGIDIAKFSAISSNISYQAIGAYGKISNDPNDFLYFYIRNFDLSQFNPLVTDIKIGGKLRSEAKMSMLMDSIPQISVFNNIQNFKINDIVMGFIDQSISWDSLGFIKTITVLKDSIIDKKIINGNEVFFDTIKDVLRLKASYLSKTDSFFVLLNISNLKINPIKKYVEDYIIFNNNTKIDGILNVKGNTESQDIQGFISLFGAFKILKTGVRYSLNDGMRVSLTKNLITIENTVLTGPGLTGDANFGGTIKHNKFEDPYFNLYFRADTISFMDLPRTNSGKYYGSVIASGDVDVKGYLQSLSITASIITEPKTNLTLLLDRPEEVTNKTAIVSFISPDDTLVIETDDNNNENSNIDIDINIKLKPEAKFKLIFDELTDESILIQGEGNIKIKQSAIGDIVVLGKIIIENGEYNFVLENIINRKFIIQKGSSITFNGEPTDGILDITTIYTIKNVGLYNLLLDDAYLDSKTQADCYIGLKGQILQPEIKFNIDLPKADRKIATQVTNLDAANMNKQFLSLLLIGRFQPLPGLVFDPNANLAGANFNAGELISNQLNSLLSNLGSDIDLDVNYITGDQATTDQFDMAVSVPLLNERVSINTDVGVGGNNVNTQDQNNNFIGDFEIDVKLNKKGNLILKGFNKTNRNDFYESGYTQGVGLLFKTDLDNIFSNDTTKIKNNNPNN
ncbi:MAG: translocation/assembly module TamB domain-containing protein, partial [Bacteroidales bacterium]|nr:translocation/assembly module TamB domain-containing protein [Bacteroidales bacterium]